MVWYIADGEHRGSFWHRPPDGEPRLIERPKLYDGLALEERAAIVKIHGAVDRAQPDRDSYVITEDHYIDYLTKTEVGQLLPAELLVSLTRSKFLFLGYSMQDWNLRVILHRIWGQQPLAYKSWAIQNDPSEIERAMDVIGEAGTVRAGTIIVTTGTASLEFKQLRRHFKRRESYLVLTEPIPAPVRKQLVSRDTAFNDTKTPHHRVRWTPDDRILVGGAEQDETPEKKRAAVLVQRTGQLMYELLTMFPIISGLMPAYGWELISGETADGLMYIGPHRNYPRHLFALGSGGDSVTGAFLAARILVRALQDASEKEDAVWGFTR